MSSISVYLESNCVDIENLAKRLGGVCSKQSHIQGGIEQVFDFQLESMAEQFHASVLRFPELISIGSPLRNYSQISSIEEAIAASRLCKCGVTTMLECGAKKCEVTG